MIKLLPIVKYQTMWKTIALRQRETLWGHYKEEYNEIYLSQIMIHPLTFKNLFNKFKPIQRIFLILPFYEWRNRDNDPHFHLRLCILIISLTYGSAQPDKLWIFITIKPRLSFCSVPGKIARNDLENAEIIMVFIHTFVRVSFCPCFRDSLLLYYNDRISKTSWE